MARVQAQIVDLARDTRTQLDGVGELYARIARSSTQLGASQADVLRVTKAVSQAIQISGNTAQEASAGMIQLAQALASGTLRGDELRSVLEQMPRVAQAIADGLGTTIGKLRELGAAGQLTSEQVFGALISQSRRLNDEFSKIRPTVGQSMTVLINELKLATAELFETTGSTSRLTVAINLLSDALREARGAFAGLASIDDRINGFFESTKSSIDELTKENKLVKFLADSDRALLRFLNRFPLPDPVNDFFKIAGSKVFDVVTALSPLRLPGAVADILDGESEFSFTRGGGPRRGGRRGGARPSLVQPADIQEFNVALRQIELSPYEQVLQDMEDLTKTSTERQLEDFNRIRESLRFLREEGRISQDTFKERLGAAQDELLPEFDIEAIRRLYKPVEQQTSETSEFIKGVWRSTGESIRGTLSDAFYNGEVSLRSFVDVFRRAMADILSAIVTSGIKDALSGQFGSSNGFLASLFGGNSAKTASANAFGAGFLQSLGINPAPRAGGGRFDGLALVGDEGPELVGGSGQVFNRRQMAFAGGAPINFAPVTNVSIIEREDPDRTKREIFEVVAVENARQQEEFVRQLGRSGVQVK